jgi:hypothetical protein
MHHQQLNIWWLRVVVAVVALQVAVVEPEVIERHLV